MDKIMKLITQGNTAEIYEYSHNQVCKLFYPEYPKEYVEHEFHNAALVAKAGINTPKAYEIITVQGRFGIIYDRIIGTELTQSIYDESHRSKWLDRFAQFHKQLLQCRIDELISYKDFLKIFAADPKTIMRIDSLPDDHYLLHGDFHLGNIMVVVSDHLILLDMMNACKGPVLYDVARTYFLLSDSIRGQYLSRMGYTLESITPYLDVISAIRENEIKR